MKVEDTGDYKAYDSCVIRYVNAAGDIVDTHHLRKAVLNNDKYYGTYLVVRSAKDYKHDVNNIKLTDVARREIWHASIVIAFDNEVIKGILEEDKDGNFKTTYVLDYEINAGVLYINVNENAQITCL